MEAGAETTTTSKKGQASGAIGVHETTLGTKTKGRLEPFFKMSGRGFKTSWKNVRLEPSREKAGGSGGMSAKKPVKKRRGCNLYMKWGGRQCLSGRGHRLNELTIRVGGGFRNKRETKGVRRVVARELEQKAPRIFI